MLTREVKHDNENSKQHDTGHWCCICSHSRKFDLNFYIARACQVYTDDDAVQCESHKKSVGTTEL